MIHLCKEVEEKLGETTGLVQEAAWEVGRSTSASRAGSLPGLLAKSDARPAGELGAEAKKSLQLLTPPLDRQLMDHQTTRPADARHRAPRTNTAL